MDTFSAFERGKANAHKPLMVFDWDKAAQILKDSGCDYAEAGLAGDWGYTGGCIWENRKICRDSYTYLSSTWATPQLLINGEYRDCYIMQDDSPGWHSETKWPESAVAIINQ